MSATVAIVGRPNVGKSTFYNRLVGSREAIVDNTSGVTRDRLYGVSDWNGEEFIVVDTGGFVPRSEDVFEKAIRSQVDIALDEADVIVFMVDVTTGITDLDMEMTQKLRKSKKPLALVVNKVDNSQRMTDAAEFYSLGFPDLFMISSINGSGTGELLDFIVEEIRKKGQGPGLTLEEESLPKFAIIGQPNVGKSSYLNAILNEERNVVTDIAGTTRDSIHTHYKYYQKEFLLIDTAGVRKKSKVYEDLEFYSVMRAVKAIEQSDVCLLMIDATMGMERQDLSLIKIIERKKKGLVILVNKWDLVNKETNTAKDFEEEIKKRTAPFTDVPVVFISALTKQRIYKSIETALDVYKNRQKKIPTSKLNDALLPVIERTPPPSARGQYIKVKYITQVNASTPTFVFFTNFPQLVKQPYKNFLENRIRELFDFTGVIINIVFKKK